MPNYDYHCDACHADLEIFQSMKDDPITDCPKCGNPKLRRLIGTGAGIIFKGSGFYETDYKTGLGDKKEGTGEAKPQDKKKPADKQDAGGGADKSKDAKPAAAST